MVLKQQSMANLEQDNRLEPAYNSNRHVFYDKLQHFMSNFSKF